jgi:hypothetical protein
VCHALDRDALDDAHAALLGRTRERARRVHRVHTPICRHIEARKDVIDAVYKATGFDPTDAVRAAPPARPTYEPTGPLASDGDVVVAALAVERASGARSPRSPSSPPLRPRSGSVPSALPPLVEADAPIYRSGSSYGTAVVVENPYKN